MHALKASVLTLAILALGRSGVDPALDARSRGPIIDSASATSLRFAASGPPATDHYLEAPAPAVSERTFSTLTFRPIGPATMGGRVDDFAVYEPNPAIFYVATATGGLWKTVNNGTTWEVLFNDQPDVVSIGDVAIASDDAQIVWVGTGENNNRQSSSWGNGVYKSTDGGHTWKHMGLADTHHIGRVVIDPADHQIVYVAATGHLWGSNKERGVFKTVDGGETWAHVLSIDSDTGATDLVLDPANRNVLYAATYQRQRAAWGFNGGGSGSGIHKSTDGGKTWRRLAGGIPAGALGRIGLDIYGRNPRVLYARIEHETESGLYRTDDGGESWRKISDFNPRPMYFSEIRIDPNSDHRIYVLGVNLYMSDDGGRTFVSDVSAVQKGVWPEGSAMNASIHSDHHALWINPANSSHLITGNDGGVGISYDRGLTWDHIDNMDLAQVYHVGFDMERPYNVYAGLQDNLNWSGPSATRSYLGIGNGDWSQIGAGDGFVSLADPRDSRTIYSESQSGNLLRVDRLTNERKSIRPEPSKGEDRHRWSWNTPMIVSPHDPATIFIAAQKVFRSTDRGDSWQAISSDLTSNIERDELPLMRVRGSDIKLSKHDGVSAYPTVVAFAESPRKRGVYYAGSDDGRIHISRDEGKSWKSLSDRFSGVPKSTYVAAIVASAADERRAYVAFDGHRSDDYKPYIFSTSDFGETWKPIVAGIPAGHAIRAVAEDLKNPDVLYAGTEFGLFVSLDRGGQWTQFRSNLPTVPVHEIALHPRDNAMILATHGRGIWILDDLKPIQQLADAMGHDAHLFDVAPAVQYNKAHDKWFMWGDRRFWGQNPPVGVAISYYLRSSAKEVTVRVRDGAGRSVRGITGRSVPRAAGINQVLWDLRYDPLSPDAPEGKPDGTRPTFGAPQVRAHSYQDVNRVEADPLVAPFVLPAEYRVGLIVDGREIGTTTATVLPDPMIQVSDVDRTLHHDTSLMLHRLQQNAREAIDAVKALGERFALIQRTVNAISAPPADLTAAVRDFEKTLNDVRAKVGVAIPRQRPAQGSARDLSTRAGSVKSEIMGSTSRPTADQLRARREIEEELGQAITDINAIITTTLPALQKRVLLDGAQPAPLKPLTRVTTSSQ